jgi:hypothetical protein
MKNITLNLGEILQLESEINGSINQDGQVTYIGFLRTNLPILLKYDLMSLSEYLLNERKKIDTLRDSLVLKYGKKDENDMTKLEPIFEENGIKVINPKYVEFNEEYKKLLNQEIEITYPEITKDDLKNAGNTTDNYKILFKLIV